MTIETIEYGEVMNSTLVEIFGDEMTYNQLRKYGKYKDETTYLKVKFELEDETRYVTVWFDSDEVMYKEYGINYSCDMFYLLNQLEPEKEDDDELYCDNELQ